MRDAAETACPDQVQCRSQRHQHAKFKVGNASYEGIVLPYPRYTHPLHPEDVTVVTCVEELNTAMEGECAVPNPFRLSSCYVVIAAQMSVEHAVEMGEDVPGMQSFALVSSDIQAAFVAQDTVSLLKLILNAQRMGAAAVFVMPPPNNTGGDDEPASYNWDTYKKNDKFQYYVLGFDFEGKPFEKDPNAAQIAKQVRDLDVPCVMLLDPPHAFNEPSSLTVAYGPLQPSVTTSSLAVDDIPNTLDSFLSQIQAARQKIEHITGHK